MWIKICANTTAEDAIHACELGADAVGFVFAPSKRQVTPAQVRAISGELPPRVERVGVFGEASADEIAGAVETARLTAVQLHHGFDPAFTRQLQARLDAGVSIIQTAHWTVGEDDTAAYEVAGQLARMAEDAAYPVDAPPRRVLVDAKVGGVTGGTGVSFDWRSGRHVLQALPGMRFILAGGLCPENVADAIGILRPWGVDVASGVEREPGRKDRAKLAAFIANARLG